jgi:hypothetical protein
VTDLHRFENFERAGVASRTSLAQFTVRSHSLIDLNVAFTIDAANVMIVFVRQWSCCGGL